MRIFEILLWNDYGLDESNTHPDLNSAMTLASNNLADLANAFTRSGLVKYGWNLTGSEGQPSRPAPPDAGTELIPSGTLEPNQASWEPEPVEEQPVLGPHRLAPFRQ